MMLSVVSSALSPYAWLFEADQFVRLSRSSLMVENTKNNAFAGAASLKTFMNGPQELSITDTANSISVALWTKLGGQQLPWTAWIG